MTARVERRRKRTMIGAVVALALVVVAAALTAVGANTVINSTEGEAVQLDERRVLALPQTDNAALAIVDDDNRLTSLVVATLLPSGEGGSIVTIPVDADASIGLGDERRPLNALLDPADPDGFFQAVEQTLAISLQFGEIVGADRLAELIEPVTPVAVELPFVPITTEPTDSEGPEPADALDPVEARSVDEPEPELDVADSVPADAPSDDPGDDDGDSDDDPPTTATTITPTTVDEAMNDEFADLLVSTEFDTEAAVAVLRSTPTPGTHADRQANDVAMWSALAAAAPTLERTEIPVDEFGAPTSAVSIDEVLQRLWQGPVQVRDLAVSSAESSMDDVDAGVSILDRFDSLLVFAQISPARVSTPNEGLVFRVQVPINDAQFAAEGSPFESRSEAARSAVGQLLFLQGNVTSVDVTPNPDGAPALNRVEVADERVIDDLERRIVPVFGDAEFVVADQLIDGVDVVLTIGTGYLDVFLSDASASSADDADTVDADG